jgi:hypothetical protein
MASMMLAPMGFINMEHLFHDVSVLVRNTSIAMENTNNPNIAHQLQLPLTLKSGSSRKMKVSGNEICLISDVLNGSIFTPRFGSIIRKGDLDCLPNDIEEADRIERVGQKWGVCTEKLISKMEHMPCSVTMDVLNFILEAWKYHEESFVDFLRSGRFDFTPITSCEPECDFLIGASLASGEFVVHGAPSHVRSEESLAVLHAIARISSDDQPHIEREVVFDDDIGVSRCIATHVADDIVYAQREGRLGLTRFVRGREPEKCKNVCVVLRRSTPQKYVLIDGFVGCKPEPELFDTNYFARCPDPAAARHKAQEFWGAHALVWSPDDIVAGTERQSQF